MYNKLFTKILDSSIWLETTPTRIVWLTFIAVMDEKGFAPFAAVGNVANRARVTLEEAKIAISVLEAPDPESSDPEFEGRRLERVPGGWIILNAEKHRDLVTRAIKQAQTAERVRRFRQRKRESNARVTTSEAYTYTEARSEEDEEKAVAARPQNFQQPVENPRDNLSIITKLAHLLLNEPDHPTGVDLKEALKDSCARKHIAYDSTTIGLALDSAEAQRAAL
jgi:hypothetical protein